jgi:Thiamine pyrophosphate enzyme, N-terminal TPP binding domain/GMC oxidoreductase/Thiamine pyrophosphate enzyme, central domain
MSKLVSEELIERLADWGVSTIFGLPGDGINGIMEGLRPQDRIRFVLVHHEEAATFMPTGCVESTGRLGVCLATSGPGAIHLLDGLYVAKLDHAPVLAITRMQETQMLGTGYQQEVALEKLFMDVAEYNEMLRVPAQLPSLVDIAIRHALSRRGVAHLTIPTDIQIADARSNPWSATAPAVNKPTAPLYLPASGLPRPEDVHAAADVLNAGSKVVMLVGAGALGARDEVLKTAEALGSPIVKTLPGKAVVPDDHPLCIGGIGLLGTGARLVAVAGYSIETTRLLLNSACPQFPEGLCNEFDQVGRYVMVQGALQTTGRYEEEIRAYKAPPPECSTEAFYETDPTKSYKRGFSLQCISPLPIVFSEHVSAQGHWGETLREYCGTPSTGRLSAPCASSSRCPGTASPWSMRPIDTAFLWRISPTRSVTTTRRLWRRRRRSWRTCIRPAGAAEAITIKREVHLIGGCRMAAAEQDGVVDADLRSFAAPDLFIVDGSVCPTQGSANPALTIMALAARAADYLTTPSSAA